LIRYYKDYDAFKEGLDSRSLSRLQELEIKSTTHSSVEIVLGLRSKIGRFYKSVEMPSELLESLRAA